MLFFIPVYPFHILVNNSKIDEEGEYEQYMFTHYISKLIIQEWFLLSNLYVLFSPVFFLSTLLLLFTWDGEDECEHVTWEEGDQDHPSIL